MPTEIIVTEELIERLGKPCGYEYGGKSWTKVALAHLGVEYPPTKGWKKRIIGKPLSPLPGAQMLLSPK